MDFLMHSHVGIWGQFLIAATLIIFAGYKLTRYGDVLSDKLHLGHVFIGAMLIGWSTSLPEFVLSVGTTMRNHPEIAVGNIVGSNLFNIFIIVLLDLCYWKGPILKKANPKIKLTINVSLVMIILLGIALYWRCAYKVPFIPMGYDTLFLLVVYFVATFIMYRSEKKSPTEEDDEAPIPDKYNNISLGRLLFYCLLVIIVIIVSGLWMSGLAPYIAERYHLGTSFVGSFFLAIISSLPEVVTSFMAVRLGFANMAFGIVFGSNIFNVILISVSDIFYQCKFDAGNILSNGSVIPSEYYPAILCVILMTLTVLFVIKFLNKKERKFFVGIESLILAILYVFAMYCMYNPAFWKQLTSFCCTCQ